MTEPDASAEPTTSETSAKVLAGLTWTTDAALLVLVISQTAKVASVAQLRATADATAALRAVVVAAADAYRECEVIEYGPNTLVGDAQVMTIQANKVPLLQAIVAGSADVANLDLFDPTQANLKRVRLAAIKAEAGTNTAVFVQALGTNKVVARSKETGFLVTKGVLDVPKGGELLLLGNTVSTVVINGVAFFRDRAGFQRLFGYLAELREQAAATFVDVTKDLKIENRDDMLAAATGNVAMLGKMASIQSKLDKYPAYRAALTMANLKTFVDAHPEWGIEMTGDGDDAQFVFRTDPQHRFKILKLLDDDFLRSELTQLEYEANSKGAPLG